MGKYIHLFQTKEEFNQAVENNFTEPWVSYTKENDKVDYYKTEYDRKCEQYFTIEATQDGTTIYFRQSSYAVNEGLDALKVEVSTDNGETWTEITAAPTEGNIPGATLAELTNAGDKVLIRGNNEAYGCVDSKGGGVENCNFYADSPCYIYGNIMSLIGGDTFARLREVKESAFSFFFSDSYEELDLSWVLLKEDDKLLLPATTLAKGCYFYMFSCCTGLTTTPTLPATTLADSCYLGMFNDCTNLTTAPSLPATTLASDCYNEMFSGTGITTAPELPATTLAEGCYEGMFSGCNALTTVPQLPATTLAEFCYSNMFNGCTGLTVAPKLPATTLAEDCYRYMFSDCTSLTSAPELPATMLMENCYEYMFYNCTNLSYIKAMFTTTPGSSYTKDWVRGVKETGTFVKNPEAIWDVTGNNGIPSGWTVRAADEEAEEYQTEGGTTIYAIGPLEHGAYVYANAGCTEPLEDGTYVIPDEHVQIVVENGIIEEAEQIEELIEVPEEPGDEEE